MVPRESKRGEEPESAGAGDNDREPQPGNQRPTDAFLAQLLAAGEAEDAALEPGSKVGRYVIAGRLGAGGMGVVYRASDPTLDRDIALKVMPVRSATAASATEASTRLLREAQAMAKLAHPNVVAVHDVGMVGDEVFVAMELVAGKTPIEWQRDEAPSQARILEVFIAAGRGIEAAHRAGLVHRDFKPENVIVGEDGRVRVLDFGLARAAQSFDVEGDGEGGAAQEADRSAQHSSGGIIGTPAYMAPEQHLGRELDARTDQFSFCVALYEALYGEPPFAGKSITALEETVTGGRVSEPPEDTAVSPRLRRALLRGLAVSPDDRYPSMTALLADLESETRTRRSRLLTAALAAATAAAIAAAVGIWYARKPAPKSVCADAQEHLSGVWDPAVKESVRGAFLASGRPHARTTFDRVEKILDGHAAAWVAMRTEACEATHVHRRQPEETLAVRTRCLDRRLAELGDLVTGFSSPADDDVVDNAIHTAFTLGRLEQCADADALARLADTGAPAEPSAAAGCGLKPGLDYNPLEVGRVWVYDVVDPSTGLPLSEEPKVLTVEALEEIGGCKGKTTAFRTRRDFGPGYAIRWQEVKTVASPEGFPPGRITLRHRDRWLTNDGRATKEEYYEPARVRLDATCAHTLPRATYVDSYAEVEVLPGEECGAEIDRRTKTYDWQVVDASAVVILDLDYSHPACCASESASESASDSPSDSPGERVSCRPPRNGPGHSCRPKAEGKSGEWTCTFDTMVVRRREVGGSKLATYWFAPGVGKVKELSRGEEIEELVCFAAL